MRQKIAKNISEQNTIHTIMLHQKLFLNILNKDHSCEVSMESDKLQRSRLSKQKLNYGAVGSEMSLKTNLSLLVSDIK